MMGRVVLLLALTASGLARADDSACDKFKWSVAKERALFAAPAPATATQAITVGDKAYRVTLAEAAPFAAAPQRAPKAGTHAAALAFTAAKDGVYAVTLSDEGWIDVVEGGSLVRSSGFTGAIGCAGVRKSVRFDLKAGAAKLQISNVEGSVIDVAVTTAP